MDKEPPQTPRSKLETLTKEDLIRFAKKQNLTCKQLRERNEELESKLRELSAVNNRQSCEISIQTVDTQEKQEENQWLRMALTTKDQVDAENAQDGHKSMMDNFSQTEGGMVFNETMIENPTVSVECQTDDESTKPKSTPPSNPDALKESKMQLQLLANELDEARRQLANQSMLKLEMDDTERSFAKLQAELRQATSLLASVQNENVSLSSEIQTLQKRLSSVEMEREKAEKKSVEVETSSESMRKELNASKSNIEAMETKLTKAMEELEKMKLDTATDVSSTQRRLCDLQTALDENRRRLEKSENERTHVERQLDELNNEYRAYRTRVHSVLKQGRKTGDTEEADGVPMDQRQSAEQQLINSLREQLEKTKQLYETYRCDLERVREQHDQLYERHRMLRTHADEAEAQWKCELEALRADAARVARLHAEQIRTLTTDKRDMQREFDRKSEDLIREGKIRAEMLEQRVEELERELDWSRRQLLENERKTKKIDKESDAKEDVTRRRLPNESFDFTVSSRPLMERKPGEGAENMDITKRGSTATGIGLPLEPSFDRQQSLEDLLGDQQSIRSFDISVDRPIKDENAASAAKLRHLTELLSESEANNSRLTEQIKLLKDEIRRLERNNERSEHIANAEYLKNIVLQFLNPTMGDRKQRLLPVLTTLLRLSPEEVAILNAAIPETQAPSGNSTNSSGWSGYIHRWSGFN